MQILSLFNYIVTFTLNIWFTLIITPFLSWEHFFCHLENNCSECYALHTQHHDICSVSVEWAEALINVSEERPSSWTRISSGQHMITLIKEPYGLNHCGRRVTHTYTLKYRPEVFARLCILLLDSSFNGEVISLFPPRKKKNPKKVIVTFCVAIWTFLLRTVSLYLLFIVSQFWIFFFF